MLRSYKRGAEFCACAARDSALRWSTVRAATGAFAGLLGCSLEEKLAPSVHEGQTVRDPVRKNVGVQHHDDTDDGAKRNRMPKHEAENHAFVAKLIGGGGGYADGLRVDHFPHHATGAVRGGHQNWI